MLLALRTIEDLTILSLAYKIYKSQVTITFKVVSGFKLFGSVLSLSSEIISLRHNDKLLIRSSEADHWADNQNKEETSSYYL